MNYEIINDGEGVVIKYIEDSGNTYCFYPEESNNYYQILLEEHGQQFLDDIANA